MQTGAAGLTPVAILGIGAVVMLLHDAIGATATRLLAIPIAWFYPISLIIWSVVGFFVVRQGGIRWGLLAGLALGVIDCTAGWWIASSIKGGGPSSVGETLITLGSMTLLAVACSMAGGGLARLVQH